MGVYYSLTNPENRLGGLAQPAQNSPFPVKMTVRAK